MPRRGIAVLLFALLAQVALPPAELAAEEVERYAIRIGVIRASNEESSSEDGVAASVRERLRSQFQFTSYRMLQQASLSLGVSEVGRVLLPNDARLEVVPTSSEGSVVHLILKIMRSGSQPQTLEISARSDLESYLVLGSDSHKHAILILVISSSR